MVTRCVGSTINSLATKSLAVGNTLLIERDVPASDILDQKGSGNVYFPSLICAYSSLVVVFANGMKPHNMAYTITPIDHKSTAVYNHHHHHHRTFIKVVSVQYLWGSIMSSTTWCCHILLVR